MVNKNEINWPDGSGRFYGEYLEEPEWRPLIGCRRSQILTGERVDASGLFFGLVRNTFARPSHSRQRHSSAGGKFWKAPAPAPIIARRRISPANQNEEKASLSVAWRKISSTSG